MVLPRPRSIAWAILGSSITLAACGGQAPGPGGGDVAASPSVTPQTNLTVRPGEEGPWLLDGGTYRVRWTTTDCASIAITLEGDNGFTRTKTSNLPSQVWLITSVPDGNYTLKQTETGCTTWELTLTKITS